MRVVNSEEINLTCCTKKLCSHSNSAITVRRASEQIPSKQALILSELTILCSIIVVAKSQFSLDLRRQEVDWLNCLKLSKFHHSNEFLLLYVLRQCFKSLTRQFKWCIILFIDLTFKNFEAQGRNCHLFYQVLRRRWNIVAMWEKIFLKSILFLANRFKRLLLRRNYLAFTHKLRFYFC